MAGAGATALIGIGRRVYAGTGAGRTQQLRGYCQKTLAPEKPTTILSLRAQAVHCFFIGFSGAFLVYAIWFRITADRLWIQVLDKKY